MTEENFAQAIREVAVMLRDAEYSVLKTEADVKRVIAKAMLEGEMNGNKVQPRKHGTQTKVMRSIRRDSTTV